MNAQSINKLVHRANLPKSKIKPRTNRQKVVESFRSTPEANPSKICRSAAEILKESAQ